MIQSRSGLRIGLCGSRERVLLHFQAGTMYNGPDPILARKWPNVGKQAQPRRVAAHVPSLGAEARLVRHHPF